MSLMNIQNTSMVFKSRGKNKGTICAVSDINLDIKEGEIIALVGESGCGKTTLGKMIAGVHKPTNGKILYKGKDIYSLSAAEFKDYRLGVQMVHQDSYAALNPNKTIYQSLSLPLFQHKIAKNDNEAIKILSNLFNEVGLNPPEQFLEKYPHQLSGGQRQRTLLARALSVKPRLIVADEPVSMVDVSMRIALLDLMSRMNDKYKISFVYITHDLGTARYIAANGRIIVMYLGKIIEMNGIIDALHLPMHPYFKALVAAVPEADKDNDNGFGNKLPLRSLDMPDLLNLPDGCRFHPRCPYYDEICERTEPELAEMNGGMVACHKAETLLKNVAK